MTSSAYGKVVPAVKPREPAAPPDVREAENCTFKPDTSVTRKMRAQVVSSGYGKDLPAPKGGAKDADAPTFRPDTASTARQRKKATSSGYGKVVASPKTVDSKKYLPDFKPKMNFSKRAIQARKEAESRLLQERQRPNTAPETKSPKAPLLHTLAADHSEPAPEQVFEGPDFVVDGSVLSQLPPHLSDSLIDKAPPPC